MVFEEFFRSRTERKKLACPDCGSDDVGKLFSLFGMGRSSSGDGSGSSSSSGCGSCTATSCKGCKA